MKYRVTFVETKTYTYEREGTLAEAEELAERLSLGYIEENATHVSVDCAVKKIEAEVPDAFDMEETCWVEINA